MTSRRHIRLLAAVACVAAMIAAVPGEAAAAKRKKPHPHRAANTPTIVINHIYDAGGNGAPLLPAPGQKINLFDPVSVAIGLGNQALGQLGLPPLPVPPAL
jgi:hypothetical protein